MLFLCAVVTFESDPFKQTAAHHKRVLTSLFSFEFYEPRMNHQFHMKYHRAIEFISGQSARPLLYLTWYLV